MLPIKVLEIAKSELTSEQFNILYLYFWNNFYKSYSKEYLEVYRAFGYIEAVKTGISSAFGKGRDIDQEKLHGIASSYADLSIIGYPTSFYEPMKEYLLTQ